MGFPRPNFYQRSEDGPLVLEDVPVFRSGIFRDSWGEQHTWQDYDIKQMVINFDECRASMLIPHVPVRDRHPGIFSNGGEVVGWHTALRTEQRSSPVTGMQYEYLLATYEVTEPDAAGKIERGTWRNRSAEIGRYTTNDEQEIWPLYMGVAYVDLPAVEGLEGFSWRPPEGEREQIYVREASGMTTPAPPRPVVPGQVVPPPTSIRVHGQEVADVGAVQRHIDVLEQFQRETQQANRDDFVRSLAEGSTPRVLASQVESLTVFARQLSPEQFASWRATWDVQAPQGLTQIHGQQTQNQGGAGVQAPDSLDTAEAIIRQHELAGMAADKIEKTASFGKLVQAGRKRYSVAPPTR